MLQLSSGRRNDVDTRIITDAETAQFYIGDGVLAPHIGRRINIVARQLA